MTDAATHAATGAAAGAATDAVPDAATKAASNATSDASSVPAGPIFTRDGVHYVATSLARGPWDAGSCHGGAPAALLAAAIDTAPSLVPMQGVRLTYDLVRPVPLSVPLDLDVAIIREGRRIQVVDATLTVAADGTELVRCRGLRIRTTADLGLPADRPVAEQPLPALPETLPRLAPAPGFDAEGFWTAVDVRLISGRLGDPGVGRGWFRVVAPLTDATDAIDATDAAKAADAADATDATDGAPLTLTPLARVAACGDFGNGIGAPLPMGPFRYVNPDLTIDLHRLPIDEWVSLEARSVAEPHGIGLTTGTLGDRGGVLGTSLQSLFIDAG